MLGAPSGAASNPVVAMILYIRLGKSSVVGRELEPESDLRPRVGHERARKLVVCAEVQRERREVARTEALCVDGLVQIRIADVEHAEDLLVQGRARAGAGARVVRDRGRVALDLTDAQEDMAVRRGLHDHHGLCERIRRHLTRLPSRI